MPRVHGSEALIIYFTDGSIMGLATGSNPANLTNDENGPRPEDFHVSFRVNWVPELPKRYAKTLVARITPHTSRARPFSSARFVLTLFLTSAA